ncbi:hypothetical protein [Baaleninema sp.]|uniref:hypothetical protein n=1 Tax=Baaleninema sp. TaxID=3101197 RepID=UPI003D059410
MDDFIKERITIYIRQQVPIHTQIWRGQYDDGTFWSFAPPSDTWYPGLQNVERLTVTEAHHQTLEIEAFDETQQLAIVDFWGYGYQGLQVDPDGEVWEAAFLGGNPRELDSWEAPYQLV